MANIQILDDADAVAEYAAKLAIDALNFALEHYAMATWVLAGGTSPLAGYASILRRGSHTVDWSRVIFALGDERCGPSGHELENWGVIDNAFLSHLRPKPGTLLKPPTELQPAEASVRYAQQLAAIPTAPKGSPRFDHVWLGVGEDGHTLSLFPNHDLASSDLVVPVYDAPKLPPDRISLSLAALAGTVSSVIFITGKTKADVLQRVRQNDTSLPVVRAARVIENSGGQVMVLADRAASNQK